jgi:hypothetical protein
VWGAYEFSVEYWQLVTASHDEMGWSDIFMHKVMTTPVLVAFRMNFLELTKWLPSKSYCGVFYAIAEIYELSS